MPCFSRISSASMSARGTTGTPWSRAATTSGLVAATAVETTTTSAPATFSAAWPIAIDAPSRTSRRVITDSVRSEPGDLVTLRHQHFGDAAHARAADADEVDALDFVFHRAASSRHTAATRCAASALALRMRRFRHSECARTVELPQQPGEALGGERVLPFLPRGAGV
jgi:hypothetical protein